MKNKITFSPTETKTEKEIVELRDQLFDKGYSQLKITKMINKKYAGRTVSPGSKSWILLFPSLKKLPTIQFNLARELKRDITPESIAEALNNI